MMKASPRLPLISSSKSISLPCAVNISRKSPPLGLSRCAKATSAPATGEAPVAYCFKIGGGAADADKRKNLSMIDGDESSTALLRIKCNFETFAICVVPEPPTSKLLAIAFFVRRASHQSRSLTAAITIGLHEVLCAARYIPACPGSAASAADHAGTGLRVHRSSQSSI